MRKVFASSCEDNSSGAVDWFNTLEAATEDYEQTLVGFPDDECNLFEVEVPHAASDDEITHLVDEAMWHRGYEPIRWRKGKNHSAKPHAKPPTD